MVSADWLTPLFVPGDRPERFAKAAASGADAVVIDLEDAVAPAAKEAARHAMADAPALAGGVPLIVRINARDTPWHEEDLAAIIGLPVDAVMVPKAEDPACLAEIARWIGPRPLVALIETPQGIAAAREIAAHGGTERLAFGSIDYCAALGCAHDRGALLTARCELVLASALAGLAPPLDGVTAVIDDSVACEDDARHAQSLGFGGKLCIHPRQLEPARRGFMPTAAEVEWAARILTAGGDGAIAIGGAMIDAPVRSRAERIAARAQRLGGS